MLTPQTYPWEHRLLAMAHEALEGHMPSEPVRADHRTLQWAYQYCDDITRQHSRTFYMASALLPIGKRRAARALYAFCRVTDDLVDRPQTEVGFSLNTWRKHALSDTPPESDPVALAWADTRARYHIPRRYAEQLIDGVARDMHQTRYTNFEELSAYCYGVASTVGLMAMHIIGYSGPEAIHYAIKLGIALQLTNILRDVGEDWREERLYLPLDELESFGLSEQDIAEGTVDQRWRTFLNFQIERNHRLYEEATPGISMLNPDGRFAIAAAAELYRAILNDIEQHDGDVFHRRAHVSTWGKISRLPAIWFSTVASNWRQPLLPDRQKPTSSI